MDFERTTSKAWHNFHQRLVSGQLLCYKVYHIVQRRFCLIDSNSQAYFALEFLLLGDSGGVDAALSQNTRFLVNTANMHTLVKREEAHK